MSNVSLKEQLQALASQLSDNVSSDNKSKDHKSTDYKRPEHKPTERKLTEPKRADFKPRENKPIKKPKPKWLDYAQYGVELLRAYFPNCFKAPSESLPLKKGIKQDLVKRLSTLDAIVTDDKACMVKSLAYYVNTAAYHKSVVANATRIDLDGNPDGLVTAEEAKYSVDRQQAKILAKQNAVQTSPPSVAVTATPETT